MAESLTTYEQVLASVLPLLTTYGYFWLGMASNSKTGRGDPVSARLWPSAPRFQARKSSSDRNLGGFLIADVLKGFLIVWQMPHVLGRWRFPLE